mmetsp:Transcript_100716/g.300425  ORF Transcript_100716/g.300425 Transcript_100716/m.300425 type:complete len:204 (-) Transcript_100716:726-1337(-)
MPDLMISSSLTTPCSAKELLASRPCQGLSLCWSKEVMAQFICFSAVRTLRRCFCTVFGLSLRNSSSFISSRIVKAPPAAVLETLLSQRRGLTFSRKESAYLGLLSTICAVLMPRRSFSSSASSSSLSEISPKRLNLCATFRPSPRSVRPSWSFCCTAHPVSAALCSTMARSSPIFRSSLPISRAFARATSWPWAAQPPLPAMP